MPLLPNGHLSNRTVPASSDVHVSHFHPWRMADSGTESAEIVIPCPTATGNGNRRPQIAIVTLYAAAVGGTPICTITSGADDIVTFNLMEGYPSEINFAPANFTVEPGEDLTITVSGGTSRSTVMATGVIYK